MLWISSESFGLLWNSVRKLLELDPDTKFNLEESGSLKELKGNDTVINLNKALGKKAKELSEAEKEKILNWLDTSDNDEKLKEKINRGFDFDEKTIESLCKCSLAKGYYHLSVKACGKLVDIFETNKNLPLLGGLLCFYVCDFFYLFYLCLVLLYVLIF